MVSPQRPVIVCNMMWSRVLCASATLKNTILLITSHSPLTFISIWEHNVKLVKCVCGFVGAQQALCTSNQATTPPNSALHNQTQAELRAGYLGPPWYCTAQYIPTRGSPLGLDVELGIINGVDV